TNHGDGLRANERRKCASNLPSRHGSGSALSATGNRLGRTPDPHRCNIIGLRPPTNRVATCAVQTGFAGGWRGSWRPESPWLGVSARLAS
ncbi:hypothetical protein Q5585_26505, partial [Escherichia coli]|nr:hypothetical protein [Escherichia coli]